MANLETLELTIQANSASAVQSIDNLATHLVALGQAIQKPLQALTELSKQLQLISSASSKVKGLTGNIAGGSRGRTSAGGVPVSQSEALGMLNANTTDLLTRKAEAMADAYVHNATAGNLNNQQLAEGALQIRKVTDQIDGMKTGSEDAQESMGGLAKGIAMVKKMASTMLIRTALKAVMKGFSEAWQGAYQFSKSIGGSFAKNIDKIKGSLQGIAISIIQLLAPAMEVIAPIIHVFAIGVKYLADALQELLAWMGITSEMFDNTMDKISSFAGASKKAAKETSAAFDELNVIGDKNSDDSSPSTSGLFTDTITAELAKIQLAVGEAMIAVGLILAFSGQIPLGIGMIAIGAAAIVKTVTVDWDNLSNKTKGELAEIAAYAGTALLAIGVILAVTSGHLGLGIALMIAGAASLATAVTLSWNLDDTVKKKIANITAAVGGALLAIGAIVCLSGAGLPLGIGLLVAGAASLATSAVLNWNTTENKVTSVLKTIGTAVGGALLAVGAIICLSGAGIPLGLAMMAAGGVSLVAAIAPDWDAISKKVKEVFKGVSEWLVDKWEKVTGAVSAAWDAVKKWWEESGIGDAVEKAWDGVSGFFKDLWEGEDGKGGIKGWAVNAWNDVSKWWETNVSENIKKEGIWGGVKGFFKGIFVGDDGKGGIKGFCISAWENAQTWWTTNVTKNVEKEGVWGGVKGFFKGLFVGEDGHSGMYGWAVTAWEKVAVWWETSDLKTKVTNAWSGARKYLYDAWDSVRKSANNAWNKVKTWWETSSIGQKVTNAWSKARKYLYEAWGSIKTSATNAWNKVKDWWTGTNFHTKIVNAWAKARQYLSNAWNTIKTNVTNAWDKVKNWWTGTDFKTKVVTAWMGARKYLCDAWTTVKTNVSSAWTAVKDWWGTNVSEKIEKAWKDVSDWFTKNVTGPIAEAWEGLKTTVKNVINFIIKGLNAIGKIEIPQVTFYVADWIKNLLGLSSNYVTIFAGKTVKLWDIPELAAEGGLFDNGQLFIAREAGPEMVGTMGGHTAVANNDQIVEGIENGVRNANAEQNSLLRRQNELLMAILQKTGTGLGASSALGRVVSQSLDMYGALVGR